jgi:hypothetical protein
MIHHCRLDRWLLLMDWVNPHSWLYIDVVAADDKVEQWAAEGGSPSVLLRNGWNRHTLAEGTKIIVHGFMSKDGALSANARDIQFPDGRKLDTGSSYTGGKEPAK